MKKFKGRRFYAAFLSLWHPGLGQLRNVQPSKALGFYFANWALMLGFYLGWTSRIFLGLLATGIVSFLLIAWAIVDAVRWAPKPEISQPWYSRTLSVVTLGLVLSGFSILLHPKIRNIHSYAVRSHSMEPTLLTGERLIASNSSFRVDDLFHGQIIVFRSPDNPSTMLVKRLVALPGEVVEIQNKVLTVNGVTVPNWASQEIRPKRIVLSQKRDYLNHVQPFTVPEDTVYVLGDNRDFSKDSRFFGSVPISDILGEPLYLYWSSTKERIGKKPR